MHGWQIGSGKNYMNWIKCNLPWTFYNWVGGPKPPSLNKEIKKEFGKTQAQAYEKLEKMFGGAKYATKEYEAIIKSKAYNAAKKEYKQFSLEVNTWMKDQPIWVEYQHKLKVYDEGIKKKSFCGRELNKPGTLIEILDDKALKQYLIGDINILGGVCDDCMGFSKEAIVVRYKILNGC